MRWYYIEIGTRMNILSFVGTLLTLNIISSTIVNLLFNDGVDWWKLSSLVHHVIMMKFGANSSTLVNQVTLSNQAPIALRMRVRSLILAYWTAMTYVEILMIWTEIDKGGLISESF